MPEKKVRGLKRKTKNMINRIEQETINYPSNFHNGYWYLPLPVAQSFISSSKTPTAIKRKSMQILLDRAKHLISIKPKSHLRLRVVVAIDLPSLWNSQIIIFSGDSYFEVFFDRNDNDQKWLPLSKERNVMNEWNLIVPNGMDCLGIRQEITDEDGELFESEFWFIGELK